MAAAAWLVWRAAGVRVAAIAATLVAFRAHFRAAAALLVPYLTWALYATYLNAGITVLNQG